MIYNVYIFISYLESITFYFDPFFSLSHLLYMMMYTGRMASADGTKSDSSSVDWNLGSISATMQKT
jgi:hypothetical protein